MADLTTKSPGMTPLPLNEPAPQKAKTESRAKLDQAVDGKKEVKRSEQKQTDEIDKQRAPGKAPDDGTTRTDDALTTGKGVGDQNWPVS